MEPMRWFIRLPRYGRPMSALKRRSSDIARAGNPADKLRVAVSALIDLMRDGVELMGRPARTPRLPLLIASIRRGFGGQISSASPGVEP